MSIFADDFVDMLADTVGVQKLLGRNTYGAATYGPTTTYAARVYYKTHNVLGKDNQLVAARAIVWLDTAAAFTADDRLMLPDGSVPIVLVISQPTDETGLPAYTRLDVQ